MNSKITTEANQIVILFVEDEPNMLQLFNKVFSEKGYQVLTATNGIRALEVIMTTMPDLIISDIMMPEMDGITFFQEVKERYGDARPVFIFLTAKVDENDIINGLTIGADDYLTKPVSIRQLQLKVEAYSNRLQSHRAQISSGLIGSIKDQSIADIIQFLEISKHTGRLSVQLKGRTASMILRDGKILSAQFSPLEDSEAVYAMIALQEGTFRFEPLQDIDMVERIEASSYALILEGLKRIDEHGRDEMLKRVLESNVVSCPVSVNTDLEDDVTTEIHETKRLMRIVRQKTRRDPPEWMHRALLEIIATHCSEIESDQIDFSWIAADMFDPANNAPNTRLTLLFIADETNLNEFLETMTGITQGVSGRSDSFARIKFLIPDDLQIQMIGITSLQFLTHQSPDSVVAGKPLMIMHDANHFNEVLDLLGNTNADGFVVVCGGEDDRARQEISVLDIPGECISGRFTTWLSAILTLKKAFNAFAALSDRLKL